MDSNLEKLLEKYDIPMQYYELPVKLLGQFLYDIDKVHLFPRIVSSLRKAGITTLGQLMHVTELDLIGVRGMGDDSHDLMHALLRRGAADPAWLLIMEGKPIPRKWEPEKPYDDHLTALKNRYFERLKNME